MTGRFRIVLTERARKDLEALRVEGSKKGVLRAVLKSISLLPDNPRHPGLKTHQYHSHPEVYPGQKVWEAYAQDRTFAAYRVFWSYGPESEQITIIAITPHP